MEGWTRTKEEGDENAMEEMQKQLETERHRRAFTQCSKKKTMNDALNYTRSLSSLLLLCFISFPSFVLKFFSTYKWSLPASLCRKGILNDTHSCSTRSREMILLIPAQRGPGGGEEKAHPLMQTHTKHPERMSEFYIMVDLTNLEISIHKNVSFSFSFALADCLGRNKILWQPDKQEWIWWAITTEATSIFVVLRRHVYCDRWPRTDDHSTLW